jgi:hypothetical protein
MKLYKRIQRNPYFPMVPLVPLAVGGLLLTLEAISLFRLRRLSRTLDELIEGATPEGGVPQGA